MTNFQKCEKCGCKIEKYEFIKNENDLSKYGWWIEKFSREIHSKNKCEIFVKSKRFHKSRIRTNIANWFINHNSIYVNPVSLRNFFLASTGNLRTLPDFLIVGVAKSGTTSMYNYLIEHPTIHPINIEKEYRYPLKKEVRFFDRYYNLGTRWYKAHFPLKFSKFVQKNLKKNSFLTGESTPAYFHNPLVPKRVKQLLPKVKLIFLLRNPIERAFSHYKHNKKLNFENLTFEEAIKIESKRLEGEKTKTITDKNYFSFPTQLFSYLNSGIYIEHLNNWLNEFDREQILIINSDDFFNQPKDVMKKTYEFLNVDFFDLSKYEIFNPGVQKEISNEMRNYLRDFYKPHNEKLYKFLNLNFNWS